MKKVGVGYASITELEKKYVNDALDNSRLSPSKYVRQFEIDFAKKHKNKYGVMCNSGTSAIHIALETLKEAENWDSNTEILVPALTFISTTNAVIHAGLKPIFVDVDAKKYNIDPDIIEKRITKRTKAILPVHCFGLPCEMDKIETIAAKYQLKIIEDCSDAHFASFKNRTVGSWGDLSAFSLYVAHTITTGIGGITITNNDYYAGIMRSLIAHGRSCTCEVCMAANPDEVCMKRTDSEIDTRFCFQRMGFSYRVGEIEGALGVAQLERYKDNIKKRHENAKLITELLSPLKEDFQLPIYSSDFNHTYMMYPIMIKTDTFTRKNITDYLENNNIETRPLFPLLNQPFYKQKFGNIEDDYPNAKNISRKGFYIGCHHGLGEDEMEYIGKIFHSFINNVKEQ